jgi:tetratricopeptide (TPR) repeat protein
MRTIVVSALAFIFSSTCCHAMSEANRDALQKYFEGQGTIRHAVYAPLGGPEVGVAEIETGGSSSRLQAVRMPKPGTFETIYTQALTSSPERSPFTLMLQGRHLLVYAPTSWSSSSGATHKRGDLEIVDLTSEGGTKTLFGLKDVVDLQFAPGTRDGEGLIWQPLPHFLNTGEILPVRHQYFRLVWNERDQTYELRHHLIPLPDATLVDSANLNNRAIIYYRAGLLQRAHEVLSEASQLAEEGQSLILHNNEMVDGELDDLSMQGQRMSGVPFDEALQFFWQGDFGNCLRILETRKYGGFNDRDMAMLGLALAQERRWPETDAYSQELARRGYPHTADYYAELVRIALGQKNDEIFQRYLKALEAVDRTHPGYALGVANLYFRLGDANKGRDVLEAAMRRSATVLNDLSAVRLALYELYSQSGEGNEMTRLIADAKDGPIINLNGLADLVDYVDLRSALAKVVAEPGEDGIVVPDKPLEGAASDFFDFK